MSRQYIILPLLMSRYKRQEVSSLTDDADAMTLQLPRMAAAIDNEEYFMDCLAIRLLALLFSDNKRVSFTI